MSFSHSLSLTLLTGLLIIIRKFYLAVLHMVVPQEKKNSCSLMRTFKLFRFNQVLFKDSSIWVVFKLLVTL